MANVEEGELDPRTVQGVRHLKRVFKVLERLADSGTRRDRAGNRRLLFSHYAGLHLVGLFNPTLQSLAGLSQASGLRKVQRAIGGPRASVGSLSESVRVFDPELLEPLIAELFEELPQGRGGKRGGGKRGGGPTIPEELVRRLTVVDGSVLRALPRIVAATGGGTESWRMHLQFEVWRNVPAHVDVTADRTGEEGTDERDVLAENLVAGRTYVCDGGYERYALLKAIVAAKSDYVIRVQRRPVEVLETREPTEEARAAGVLSDEIVRLGRSRRDVGEVTHTVRRIVIAKRGQGRVRTDYDTPDELVLLTNLVDVPAEVVAAVYALRWSIELFFRFLKHVLGCRKLLSHRDEGVRIQVYCAIVAALLLALATGQDVGRRGYELVCLYLSGWAEEDELVAGLERLTRSKKPT